MTKTKELTKSDRLLILRALKKSRITLGCYANLKQTKYATSVNARIDIIIDKIKNNGD